MFWAPTSTATRRGRPRPLDAHKSWVTSAHEATAYVWSSEADAGRRRARSGSSRATRRADDADRFEGLGLRGNDSTPVKAEGVRVPASARLGADGGGFAVMMEVVLRPSPR